MSIFLIVCNREGVTARITGGLGPSIPPAVFSFLFSRCTDHRDQLRKGIEKTVQLQLYCYSVLSMIGQHLFHDL